MLSWEHDKISKLSVVCSNVFRSGLEILISVIAGYLDFTDMMFQMLNEKGLRGQDCIVHYHDCTH